LASAKCTRPIHTRNQPLQPLRPPAELRCQLTAPIPAKSVVGRRAGGLTLPHSQAAVGLYCAFETVPTNPHQYRWLEIQGIIWRCRVRPAKAPQRYLNFCPRASQKRRLCGQHWCL